MEIRANFVLLWVSCWTPPTHLKKNHIHNLIRMLLPTVLLVKIRNKHEYISTLPLAKCIQKIKSSSYGACHGTCPQFMYQLSVCPNPIRS
jgi:hypothetical protein